MKRKIILLLMIILAALAGLTYSAPGYGGDKQEIRKIFKNKTRVQINTFSGDCVVKKGPGSDIEVLFVHTYSNRQFEPQFVEEGNTLILKEKFRFSGSGDSIWTITVPEKTNIHFSSLSGDFSVEGLKSNVSARTVSGDVKARDCVGDMDLKSVSGDMEVENLSGKVNVKSASSDLRVRKLSGEIAVRTSSGDVEAVQLHGSVVIKAPSGDVEIKDSKGSFDVKTASGDIDAAGIILTKPGYFKAASGDIYVTLAQPAKFDLTLAVASGDALLNYNGNPIEGYFEFRAISGKGDIVSPFPFDKEEEKDEWGKTYVIKSFKRGKNTPKIYISTASGKAVLEEK